MVDSFTDAPPTREQLLALQPGDSIRHDQTSALRPLDNPMRPLPSWNANSIIVKRRYLEETLVYWMGREVVEDLLPDPWELMVDQMDQHAAEKGLRHRDGTPVRWPKEATADA